MAQKADCSARVILDVGNGDYVHTFDLPDRWRRVLSCGAIMNADARKQREIERSRDAAAWNYLSAKAVDRIVSDAMMYGTGWSKTVYDAAIGDTAVTPLDPRPYLIDSDGVPPKPGEFE